MFGAIQFEEFDTAKMPQDVASAWSGINGWTGTTFKPIKFLGRQVCKGVNFWFLAEMQAVAKTPEEKQIVVLAVNGFDGKYAIVPSSIEKLAFAI